MKLVIPAFILFFLSGVATIESQIVINEIRASDSNVEIKNIGGSTVNIGTYWLCSGIGEYNQLSSATLVCGGDLMLEAGALATIDLDYTLNASDDELGLYTTSSFSICAPGNMIDYVEWGSSGHLRSLVAVCMEIWTEGDFVPGWDDCVSLEYDGSGDASTDWFPQDIPTMPCIENNLDGCSIMPLELLSFEVYLVDNDARISWRAAHEASAEYYFLEHSIEQERWDIIADWVPGGLEFDYGDYLHENIAARTHYYRLLTQYADGSEEPSQIAVLKMGTDVNEVVLWPNPSNGIIHVYLDEAITFRDLEYAVIDAFGRTCLRQQYSDQSEINLSNLPAGVYFLCIPVLETVYRFIKV